MGLSHYEPLSPKSKIYRLLPELILNFFSSKHVAPEIRNFEGVANTHENMIKAKNPLSALDLRGSGTPDCVPWPQLQMSGVSVWASGVPICLTVCNGPGPPQDALRVGCEPLTLSRRQRCPQKAQEGWLYLGLQTVSALLPEHSLVGSWAC